MRELFATVVAVLLIAMIGIAAFATPDETVIATTYECYTTDGTIVRDYPTDVTIAPADLCADVELPSPVVSVSAQRVDRGFVDDAAGSDVTSPFVVRPLVWWQYIR